MAEINSKLIPTYRAVLRSCAGHSQHWF